MYSTCSSFEWLAFSSLVVIGTVKWCFCGLAHTIHRKVAVGRWKNRQRIFPKCIPLTQQSCLCDKSSCLNVGVSSWKNKKKTTATFLIVQYIIRSGTQLRQESKSYQNQNAELSSYCVISHQKHRCAYQHKRMSKYHCYGWFSFMTFRKTDTTTLYFPSYLI